MADLSDINSAQAVKNVGADLTGLETFPIGSESNGGMKTNIIGKDLLGAFYNVQVDNLGRLVTATAVLSQTPNFRNQIRKVLATGITTSAKYLIAENTAIKELHIGGLVQCQGYLGVYDSTYTDLVGTFNSVGEVGAWTNTSAGSSALLSWTYATDQFTQGTGSAKMTFTASANNDYPEITYTFPTAKDLSEVIKISGKVRVTVATGGSQTRSVQIRLTSGTAIRIYSITGTTITPPFSTEQWHTISGNLDTPTSIAGTGTFDINNVTSISLRLIDGGNKAGSVWWDEIKFYEKTAIVNKIYSGGPTTQIVFDPVISFTAGQYLNLTMKNDSAVSGEIEISASGVRL